VYQKFLEINVSSTSRLRGVFSENRNTNSSKLVERPQGRDQGRGAGREGHLRANGHLLGLCWVEFRRILRLSEKTPLNWPRKIQKATTAIEDL
jgi:hypothetical protein